MSEELFTIADALSVLDEITRLVSQAHIALDAERYVEANAWVQLASQCLCEQDVFGALAASEINACVGHS